MKPESTRLAFAACVLVGGLTLAWLVGDPVPVAGEVTPRDPAGPDMLAVFGVNADKVEARYHSHELGCLCFRIADTLQYDYGKGDKAILPTGAAMAQYRARLREYTTLGGSYATKYLALKDTVEKHLTDTAGTDARALNDETRAKWIKAFKSLGQNCQHAAENLK